MQSLYPQRPNADLIRWLALGSIAGQATWLVVTVVGGLLEPGYSVVSDAVSVLGARDAAHPWLFDVGVAIWESRSCSPRWPSCSTHRRTCAGRVAGLLVVHREGGLVNAGERGSVSAAHPESPGAGFQADD